MAYLRLNRIYKVYPNGVKAVNDFSIDIEDKEFIVFVGPSGCGKSTTLRMIAGLEEITAGELFLEDKLVNDVEAEDRDIAMVFQNYALYPHMTVYDNMAFGLRNRKVKEDVIRQKIAEAVKILDLEDYLYKKPKEMSGGQRQRVALGRAIVRNPKVFLFDEPLSNLDAKLRASMRSEITKLHKKLKTTFIYVTHDQIEAMTMGTRIVVMKDGYVQQIDAPMNLYNKPINKFVAGFIGTPQMNFFDVTLTREKDNVVIHFNSEATYHIPYNNLSKLDEKYLDGKHKVFLGVRPEHFTISKKKTGLTLNVNVLEKLGDEVIVYGDLDQNTDDFTITEDAKSIIIKAAEDSNLETGQTINLSLKVDKIHLFDGESEISLLKDIPDVSTVNIDVKKGNYTVFGKTLKLPEALKGVDALEGNVKADVPPTAIVEGDDFTLPVHKVEVLGEKLLVHLTNGDSFVFALLDKEVEIKDPFSFTLLLDQVCIYKNESLLLSPIARKEELSVRLVKERVRSDKRKLTNYYFLIGDNKVPVDHNIAKKLYEIDGRHSFKKTYKLVFNRGAVSVSDDGIKGIVCKYFDFGKSSYTAIDICGQSILVELSHKYDLNDKVALTLDMNQIEVWHPQIEFRII